MLLLLRQQRNFSTFFRRHPRYLRGSVSSSLSSACAEDAFDSLQSFSISQDEDPISPSHGAEEDCRFPDDAPARSSVGNSRLRHLSECHSLARSRRRNELKKELRRLVRDEGSGSAPSLCRLLLYSFRGRDGEDLVWDSLLEIYSRHGMSHDTIRVFDVMINQRISCSSIKSDLIFELYEKIRSHGVVIPSDSPIIGVLLGHLCRKGWIKEAVSIFQENRENGKFQLCTEIFNAMIKGSSSISAKSFISLMIKSGFSPDESTYNYLIHRLAIEGFLTEALALSEAMEIDAMDNRIIAYNSLIYGFCLHGMMNMAWKLLKMMLIKGFYPGYLTCRGLMIGYFRSGRIEDGIKIMNAIISRGYKMNIITCNIVFHALCEAGRLEELESFLHEIKINGPELDHIAYSTLIHGYSKLGKIKKVLELFHVMIARGIIPNSYNHLSLILALCRKGQLAEVRRHLRRATKDVTLYNAAIDGHGKAGDIKGALLLLGEMIKSGISPTIITFNSIIHILCYSRKVGLGRGLKDSMIRHGSPPNAVSYTTLLDAYCREGDVAAMVELFDEMVGRGIVPNTVTYSVIMKGFCRVGQLGKAAKVLYDMLSKGIIADQITFNTLIQGFCEAGNVGMALRVHEEMVNHVEPSAVTYNLLVNGLLASKNLSAAEILFNDLLKRGVQLRKFVFTALIQAECLMGSSQKAVVLFESMARAGFKPSVKDYTAAIRRLCKRRQRRLRDVKIFMDMMLWDRVYPDQLLFDAVIKAFDKEGDWRSVLVLRGKVVTSGVAANWAY